MFLQGLKTLCFVILLSGASCGGESMPVQEEPQGEAEPIHLQSRTAWQDLKEKNGDSYRYTSKELSWTGAGSRSQIEIRDGKAVSKLYEAFQMSDETGEETITDTFEETGEQLGQDPRGARPLTIDELYELCISEYLTVDEEENEVYFETFDDGIVNLCGYFPKGCSDDCYHGFTLSEFIWL